LERVFDYPRVRVLSFDRLPTPEAVDDISDMAAQKTIDWRRENPTDRAYQGLLIVVKH
jgi:hypothetical protein